MAAGTAIRRTVVATAMAGAVWRRLLAAIIGGAVGVVWGGVLLCLSCLLCLICAVFAVICFAAVLVVVVVICVVIVCVVVAAVVGG